MLGAVAAVSVLAACSGSAASPGSAYPGHATAAATLRAGTKPLPAAVTRVPATADSVVADRAPAALTAAFARTLFASAPVVVVSGTAGQALRAAGADARAAHAPVLLASTTTATGLAQLAASALALHPVAVLTAGLPAAWPRQLAARLPGVKVVGRAAALPATRSPAPLSRVAVLVTAPATAKRSTSSTSSTSSASSASIAAVTATAQAAGAAIVDVTGTDPRADPAAITALARLRPAAVVAVGAQFGSAGRLASRIAVAETGRQLPGGGQVMFPGRRLVALYGHPGTPGLGVLGEQDLSASIARARQMAAAYRPLSRVPVVPAFEIIASVAEASPGPDGSYSYETPASQLLPWVREATADGLYVVLDLQPGRSSLLAQAEYYQSLLELPDVGLALDAEWKLQPGQKPLQQIGHVGIGEVNSVAGWLAALTTRHDLPQKLLVLHQFQLAMLTGERDLDTGHDDLAIVIHMDGQGTPGVKQGTWNAVTAAAPRGVFFGWKDFLVKDHPMLTPGQTMTETPAPVMISYQ
jgi:hypothetical protein